MYSEYEGLDVQPLESRILFPDFETIHMNIVGHRHECWSPAPKLSIQHLFHIFHLRLLITSKEWL